MSGDGEPSSTEAGASAENHDFEVTTELERKLLGALCGFIAMTSGSPDLAIAVLKAAELDRDNLCSAFHGPARDRMNCTMWNLCNDSIGKPMETHAEIRPQMKGPA